MSRMGWTGLLAVSLGAAGCGGAPYVDAAGKFGTAASTSTTTLAGVENFGHQVCARRARLDYLQNRLMGTNSADGTLDGHPLYWKDWASKHTFPNPDNSDKNPPLVTWSDQCKMWQGTDAVFEKVIAALSAYAQALSTVAGEDYTGTDVGQLTTDVSGLVGAIPSLPSGATAGIKALGGSSTDAGPLGKLAGVLKQHYAAKHVAQLVNDAHPSMTILLAYLGGYADAVSKEEAQWEHEAIVFVSSLDESLVPAAARKDATAPPATVERPAEKPPSPAGKGVKSKPLVEVVVSPPPTVPPPSTGEDLVRPNAIHLADLVRFAEDVQRDIDGGRTQQDAIVDALKKLTQAETALAQAKGNDDAPEVKQVLGLVVQVLADVAAVKAAIQQGGTSK